jgi:predicted signal transduction protein with EAL and GGDEF domain
MRAWQRRVRGAADPYCRFREVDEVFEVRADDILAQDAGALAQAALEPHDFLARLARDEFAVGVPNLVHHSRAHDLGSRVLGSLAEFVAARGLQMQIGVNIGIAIYPRDAATSEGLMQAARVSLSEARESGSNQMRVFNSAAGARAPHARDPARPLARHPGRRPVADVPAEVRREDAPGGGRRSALPLAASHAGRGQSGRVHHGGRAVGPDRQARRLGDLAGLRAGAELAGRRAAGGAGGDQRFGTRFASRNFPRYLLEHIHQHDIPPSAITLEITETAAMKDIAKSLETLAELQSLGIQVALDDFGSGYSSLGYLKRLRVGTLKIDRTLIGGLDADPQGRAIVGSMVALAHELRMKVVAEGVESASQLEILHGMGCDEVQGYLLAVPLDSPGFADVLHAARPLAV